MQIIFAILAAMTLLSAIAAMSLRNLVHCALCLTVTFAGLAALFLQLGAQFVGFAQVLIYIGAVAILIVFAILLTRSGEAPAGVSRVSRSWWVGVLVAVLVFGSLTAAVVSSTRTKAALPPAPTATVRDIGVLMFTGTQKAQGKTRSTPANYILPLEAAGLLLTAAMIGAAIIAMPERRAK